MAVSDATFASLASFSAFAFATAISLSLSALEICADFEMLTTRSIPRFSITLPLSVTFWTLKDSKNQLYIGRYDSNGILKYSNDKISINKLCEHDKDYWLIKGYLNDKGLYQFDTYKPVNVSS